MIALIRLNPREIIEVFDRPPAYLMHPYRPKTRLVSPVIAGWRGGGELVYKRDAKTGRMMADEGPAEFEIVALNEKPVPPGKQRKSARVHEIDADGKVVETTQMMNVPARIPPRDYEAEIDALGARLAALEAK